MSAHTRLSAITPVSTRGSPRDLKVSEGGWREYRADDRVWAGQMTGQHGPVLRFMRHDAQRDWEKGREEERERRRVEKFRVAPRVKSERATERTHYYRTHTDRVSAITCRLFHAGGLRTI